MHALEASIRFTAEEMCEKMGMLLPGCSLNYPGGSLSRMLGIQTEDPAALSEAVRLFCEELSGRCGCVAAVPHEGGYCFTLSAQAVQNMLAEPIGGDFLREVCRLSRNHHASVTEWQKTFDRFGQSRLLSESDPEYDWLLYYPSGNPVRFVYCLKQDGEHLSVHRLDIEDFEELYSVPEM